MFSRSQIEALPLVLVLTPRDKVAAHCGLLPTRYCKPGSVYRNDSSVYRIHGAVLLGRRAKVPGRKYSTYMPRLWSNREAEQQPSLCHAVVRSRFWIIRADEVGHLYVTSCPLYVDLFAPAHWQSPGSVVSSCRQANQNLLALQGLPTVRKSCQPERTRCISSFFNRFDCSLCLRYQLRVASYQANQAGFQNAFSRICDPKSAGVSMIGAARVKASSKNKERGRDAVVLEA